MKLLIRFKQHEDSIIPDYTEELWEKLKKQIEKNMNF